MLEEPRPDIDDIGSFDNYISVMVKMEYETNSDGNIDTVKKNATDANRFAIGRSQNNPLLYNWEYEVYLEDGRTDRYFAKIYQREFVSQIDSEGHQTLVKREILYHRRDGSAVTK